MEDPENDEYKIVEEEQKGIKRLVSSVIMKGVNVTDILDTIDVESNSYYLSRFDEDTISDLKQFLRVNREPLAVPEEIVTMLMIRGECNNSADLLTPREMREMMEQDPAIGAIHAAKAVLTIFSEIYNICIDDPVGALYVIVRAESDGLLLPEDRPALLSLLQYRDHCSERIDVRVPDKSEVDSWIDLINSLMLRMYQAGDREEHF